MRLLWILRKLHSDYPMFDLGSILGIINRRIAQVLNELMVMTQPGFLQQIFR